MTASNMGVTRLQAAAYKGPWISLQPGTLGSSLQSWLLFPISYSQGLIASGLEASSAVFCLNLVLHNLQSEHPCQSL